jgi:glycosyltransferase involved in cell wall biosynthesis
MSHIAFVVPGLDRIGGAERQLLHLARGFRSRGWQVTVVALSGHATAATDELACAQIPLLCLHMRHGLADPRGWFRFNRWLRRERPDVLHAHLPHAAWFARWSRLGAPVRVVTDRLHTTAVGGPVRRIGYAISSWLTDCVTAVSQPVADTYRDARIAPAERLLVMPNGVDLQACAPDAVIRQCLRTSLGLEDSDFLWLAAGRLAPVKDYPTLLNAFALLPQSARLIIAGEGPDNDELRALVACLDLQSRVRFLGFQHHLLHWMKAADALVLSSLWEGLPMVLLEAAATALPAVATDVPGTHQLASFLAGPLPKPGDAAGLAASMLTLMRLPVTARIHLGQQARAQVAAEFSLEAALDNWESLYARLLAANPTPRRWPHPATSPLSPEPQAEMEANG